MNLHDNVLQLFLFWTDQQLQLSQRKISHLCFPDDMQFLIGISVQDSATDQEPPCEKPPTLDQPSV